MKLRPLSGWQRLGIVISICWVLGATAYVRYNVVSMAEQVRSAGYAASIDSLRDCLSLAHGAEIKECNVRHQADLDFARTFFAESIRWNWTEVLLLALVPLPFFWLLGALTLGSIRWVKTGFAKQPAKPKAGPV